MEKLIDTIKSRVNFESLWQDYQPPMSTVVPPRLLADKRVTRPRGNRLTKAVDNLKPIRPKVIKPVIGVEQRVGVEQRPVRRSTRRQQIASELGAIFSTCTFSEAREIINSCTDREEQFLLATFLAQNCWQQTRLGREIAPRLRVTR